MAKYTPHTQNDIKQMLSALGYHSTSQLFEDIPEEVKFPETDMPNGVSEAEAERKLAHLAAKNKVYNTVFMGAGVYKHYIPAAVRALSSRNEFMTATIPQGHRSSEGIMQALYEFDKLVSSLTAMDKAQTIEADAAVAAAKACLAFREEGKNKVIVSELTKPHVRSVLKTYFEANGVELIVAEALGSAVTNIESITKYIDNEVIALYLEQPNFLGAIEDISIISGVAHSYGAKLIVGVYPISLALLKRPGNVGADVAVGDCQSLGMPLGYGGNGHGFVATKAEFAEKLFSGEIVVVENGDERTLEFKAYASYDYERAKSRTFSQAHGALVAGMYLSFMGKEGLTKVAEQCVSNAHYLQYALAKAGIGVKYKDEYFNEFVTLSKCTAESLLSALAQQGILGGYKVGTHELLWCTTELSTREEMDKCAEICGEVNK